MPFDGGTDDEGKERQRGTKLDHAPHPGPQAEGPPEPLGPHEVPLQFGAADRCAGIALGGALSSRGALEGPAQDPVTLTVTPSPEEVVRDTGGEDAGDGARSGGLVPDGYGVNFALVSRPEVFSTSRRGFRDGRVHTAADVPVSAYSIGPSRRHRVVMLTQRFSDPFSRSVAQRPPEKR